MARVLVVAVLATGLPSAAQGPAPELLTLSGAIEAALAANPSVRAATLEVERAEQTLSATRTRYLPSFSLEAQAGRLLFPVKMDFPRGAFGTLPGIGDLPAERTTVTSATDSPWSRRR